MLTYGRVADGIEMMFVGIGILLLPIVVCAYWRINKHKEMVLREVEENGIKYTPEELRRMGDRAPDFEYML